MSFQLIQTPEEAQQVVKDIAGWRPTSGGNKDPERHYYRNALAMALKGFVPTRSRSVVVARYDEDRSWLSELKVQQVHVYNKGNDGFGTKLPNKGREAHTYFKHIADNYDNLTDVVFFLQGWPLDRSAGVIDGVNNLSSFDFVEFGIDILETGEVQEPMISFWEVIFNGPCPRKPWVFRANSQFGVSRERIQQRPRRFYHDCLAACEAGLPSVKAESMPYLFEQVWNYVFAPRSLCNNAD
jgi:hypothetical protein